MKTRNTTLLRMAALLSAAALTVTGCSQSTSGDTATTSGKYDYSTRLINAQKDGTPVQGGTLRVAEYSEARTMDPTTSFATGATGADIFGAIYDTLVRYDAQSDTFVPQLAKSLESTDHKTWTLTLRDGVKFSDGTPLDAKAVIASLNRYKASFMLNAMLLNQQVQTLQALDPSTVKIVLKNPWPRFPDILATGAGMIVAPAAYANPKNFKPIGAGPFTFKSYAPGDKTVVVANPTYWGGRPHLDSIEFVLLGNDNTAYDTFKSGDVDVAYLRQYPVVQQAIADKVSGMVFHAGLDINLWINARKGRPGADKTVRQAIARAVDPAMFLKRATDGIGNPSKLLLGNDSTWSPGVEGLPTDPAGAKKLLDEAKKSGYDGKIKILAWANQSSQARALAIKAMLDAVGFTAELDKVQSVADITKATYVTHDFDIAVTGTSLLDEDIYARLWNQLSSTSPTNASGYSSPEMDKLLAELQTKADPAEAKDVLTKMEKLWAEDAPGVAIDSSAVLSAWSKKVHGIKPSAETMVLFDQAWLSK